jgi:adenine phosphoribosyltransferase
MTDTSSVAENRDAKASFAVTIGEVTRELPIRTVAPGVRIAYVQMPGDIELCVAAARALADQTNAPCDVIAAPEAKAIPLAHELARLLSRPYIVLRKSVKPYMTGAISEPLAALTSSGSDWLWLDPLDAKRVDGKRVWVVDDVITTGSTVRAATRLLERSGAVVTQKLVAFVEGDKFGETDIVFAARLPLFGAP